MGGGRKKSSSSGSKKSGSGSGSSAAVDHKKQAAAQAAPPPPPPPAPIEKDEKTLALEAAVEHFSRPVEDLSAHLSAAPLKENELCRKFDIFISSETSMPEVGIQSARDLFVDVAQQQQVAVARVQVFKAQKARLAEENQRLRARAAAAAAETQQGLHQKEILATLAEELTKQKNVSGSQWLQCGFYCYIVKFPIWMLY
jgi:hypothetical protein